MRQLKDLKPNPRNPRKIDDERLEMLGASLSKFGDLSGIVYNRRFQRLCGGHQRLKKLPAAAEIQFDVVHDEPTAAGTIAEGYVLVHGERFKYREVDWPEDVEKAANLAANKHGGEWDIPLLNDFLLELDAANFDMDLTGFTAKELEDLLAPIEKVDPKEEEDTAYEPPNDPITKPGDIYVLGQHRLMCGDSTNIQHVETLMDGKKAMLVFTDPPYNVNYGAENSKHPLWRSNDRQIMNDHMSGDDFKEFCRGWISCIQAVCEGCVYVFGPPGPSGRIMFTELDQALHCSTTIVWNKDRFVLGRGKYHNKYEPCWFGWVGSGARFSKDRTLSNVWDFPRPASSDLHPTMKPVAVVEQALNHASEPRDLVLDLFGGSGTTAIAAEKTGRASRLMELDPKYCDVIVRRWQGYTGKKAQRLTETGELVESGID